ncbi:hypothetical protein UT300002_22950 [Clostridium perfringens]
MHVPHCEGGNAIDSPAGILKIHTFKKLPIINPNKKNIIDTFPPKLFKNELFINIS